MAASTVGISSRLHRRLLQHHLPLAAATTVVVALLYATRPYPDPVSRASFATAYPAIALLAATLCLGPWNLLRSKRTPISQDLRRDVGMWAGILGLLHAVIGQSVHLRGRPWLYYLYEHRAAHLLPLRHDLFGFSNFTGLVAALILLPLLATSNDRSLRALGTPQWKQLQRWNYLCFALAAAHTILYQVSEKHWSAFIFASSVSILLTSVLQVTGLLLRRRVPHSRRLHRPG